MKKSLLLFAALVFLFISCTKENVQDLEDIYNNTANLRDDCENLTPHIEIERVNNQIGDPNSDCTDLQVSISLYNEETDTYCSIDEVSFLAYTSGTTTSSGPGGHLATTFSNTVPVLSPAYTFVETGIDDLTNAHFVTVDGDPLIASTPIYFCIDYIIPGGECSSCPELNYGTNNAKWCVEVPPHCL